MPCIEPVPPATYHLTGLLIALCLAVGGTTASHAQTAGTIEFISGEASVRGAAGATRAAVRGGAVAQGETVETASGRVQLRMVDGAYISLQPQTALRFDEYSTAGSDAAGERGFMRLIRGGLRSITGAIGRVNRSAYRLSTPTATVGIRGTEFAVVERDGTRVNVAEGVIELCTTGGCLDVGAGQTGYAPDTNSRPTLTFVPARLPPVAAVELPIIILSENRQADGAAAALASLASGGSGGTSALPVIPLPNGPGGVAVASVAGAGFTAGLLGGNLTFNAAGALTQSIDCCTSVNNYTAGVSPDFGADGIIAWGRWTSGLRGGTTPLLTMNYTTNLSANAVTAPSIVRGYASFASTAPTVTLGGSLVATGAPNSVTGTMTVNFPSLTGGGSLSYALSIPVAGQTFSINGSANQFSGTGFLGTTSTIASTGAGCTPTCTGNVPFGNAIQGFFTGASAQRAGANYGFNSQIGQVTGAVVFR